MSRRPAARMLTRDPGPSPRICVGQNSSQERSERRWAAHDQCFRSVPAMHVLASDRRGDDVPVRLDPILSQLQSLGAVARSTFGGSKVSPGARYGEEGNAQELLVSETARRAPIHHLRVEWIPDSGGTGTAPCRSVTPPTGLRPPAPRPGDADRLWGSFGVRSQGPAPYRQCRRPSSSLRAYELYLQAMEAYHRGIRSGWPHRNRTTPTLLEHALREDPQFSEAYSALAIFLVGIGGTARPSLEVYPQARQFAQKALDLDPDSSQAHTAAGLVAMQVDLDWTRAAVEFRKAVRLNPSDSEAHLWYGFLLEILQRFGPAARQWNASVELDSTWVTPQFEMLRAQRARYDAVAIRALCDRLLRESHRGFWAREALAWGYASSGRTREAIALVRPLEGAPDFESRRARSEVLAILGDVTEIRQLMADWKDGQCTGFSGFARAARGYALGKDTEAAIDLLEKDRRGSFPELWYSYQDRAFDSIRHDPRFDELLRAQGLPMTLVDHDPTTGKSTAARTVPAH